MGLIRRRKTRTARRGTAAVEAALVLPMTLLFLLGIIEYGRYVMTLQVVTNAARSGAALCLGPRFAGDPQRRDVRQRH